MKKYIVLFFSAVFFSCNSSDKPDVKDLALFPEFPLEIPEAHSLMSKWENKPVLGSMVIDDMEKETGWTVMGIGEMSYTTERSKDGKRSLRFRTSLRDEEHYRKNRSEWDSFNGGQGGSTGIIMKINEPQDWSDFNRLSFWVYVHPSSTPTYCIILEFANEGTVYNTTYPRKSHFIHDLKPGEWNHLTYEIHHLERNRVNTFSIRQTLIGHNPEEEGIVTYDIDRIEIQKVEQPDQYEGWNVSPGKFSFSHAGYRPGDVKVAMAGSGAGNTFQIVDMDDNVVFSGDVTELKTDNGLFHQLDFTEYKTSGIYKILTGRLKSDPFPIDENIWLQPLFKATNAFFCLRCGYHVPGIHLECHKDWQGFHGDVKKIINGGWHDAGDLSQGSFRTAMAVYAMMLNLEDLEKKNVAPELAERLRTELAWGLEWLLKTRFGDGYHMSFSMNRIYTDNKVGTIDDVVSKASNIPWENFLAATVQSKAAVLLEKSHPDLAARSRTAAFEDWQAAFLSKKKWDDADYREASWGTTASLTLAEMTGEEWYMNQAVHFGKLVIRCQEQKFPDGIPITGFFYENTSRKKVIHNFHAAFEEAPIIALSMLCDKLPENEAWMDWYSAVVLHSEYFMKRGSLISAPYNHLPNSVWKESEIMEIPDSAVRTDMLRQYNDGTHLNDKYVLRTFPIYHDDLFHGSTNIQMSSSWALAEASRLRKDSAGMHLVGKQLQWIVGDNPFGQSLMYGEGYDFAPHFAYCLENVAGSMPVGMDCMNGDMPHWCATNNATSKEIWVEPINRFMGTLAVYNQVSTFKKPDTGGFLITAEKTQSENGTVTLKVSITGSGRHTIEIGTFNAKENLAKKEIELTAGKTETIQIDMKITDRNMPYVAVIKVEGRNDLRQEITGFL